MTLSTDYQRDWPRYFECTADKPPRDTLLRALDALGNVEGLHALDIACGVGRDSIEMLRRGMSVTATDFHEGALQRLIQSARPESSSRLRTLQCKMEDLPKHDGLPHRFGLINASFALPFCEERGFPRLWRFVRDRLQPGGMFAGQLFGDRDEWSSVNPARHFTREEVKSMLRDFRTVHFEEVEKVGDDAMGGVKHHHVYHIVVMKPIEQTEGPHS